MSLITYEDKVALNENSQIADVNKVTASDMNMIKNAINNLFPIGFIIEVDSADFNPNTSWGGTWERDKGHIIVSVDEDDPDFSTSSKTGGEKEVTLTVGQMPSHQHDMYEVNPSTAGGSWTPQYNNGGDYQVQLTGALPIQPGYQGLLGQMRSGGDQPHNNMPPYRTAYRWIKTAM